MPSVTFLIPGDLTTRTGGYEYDRRIVEGLRRGGWSVSVRALSRSFPQPSAEALVDANAALATLADGELVVIDGLALGAMPDQASAHADRLRLVALVHHPLALETGLAAPLAGRLRDSERRALACVRHVVVTSARTAEVLQRDFEVAPHRLAVVQPGTDAVPLARGSIDGSLSLVCVASLSPRKGHDVLFRALGAHRERSWRLVCVGDVQRDAATAERLRALLDELPSPTKSHLPVKSAQRGPARSTMQQTCSCWRRSMRGTEWRSPKHWPADCQSSPCQPAEFPTSSATTQVCWCLQAMSTAGFPRCRKFSMPAREPG